MERRDIQSMETIPEFFAGKNVFITGGSGFMGKVLIEKLLRSCPDIGNIYLLMRNKDGVELDNRIKKLTDNVLFDTLKKNNYPSLKKLIIIPGNIKEVGLGLSEESLSTLIQNVSIVYHVAATVRFNTTLTEAVIVNARGTREVCKLVMKLENSPMLIHFSTAFCQPDQYRLHEKVYPPHADWKEMISIAEHMEESKLNLIAAKYTEGFANTYTFSKSLGENIVNDICGKKIPTIIFRPTIVVSIYKDPMPGWCDNFNGPVGLGSALGKGIVRSIYFPNMEKKSDYVPVDIAIDKALVATWVERHNDENVSVYNASNNKTLCVNQLQLKKYALVALKECPTFMYWYPTTFNTSSKFLHLLHVYFLHLTCGIIVDTMLWACNKKPKLLKIYKLLHVITTTLEYFITNDWIFLNEKFINLDDKLLSKDKDLFGIDMESIDSGEYFNIATRGCYQLLFKEDPKDYPFYRSYTNFLWVVHHVVRTTVAVYLGLFIYNSIIVPSAQRYYNYVSYL